MLVQTERGVQRRGKVSSEKGEISVLRAGAREGRERGFLKLVGRSTPCHWIKMQSAV